MLSKYYREKIWIEMQYLKEIQSLNILHHLNNTHKILNLQLHATHRTPCSALVQTRSLHPFFAKHYTKQSQTPKVASIKRIF